MKPYAHNPMVPVPAGYHPNILFADYARLPGVSNSGLNLLLDSPEVYRDAMDGKFTRADSAEMQFGRLFHSALLENRALWTLSPYNEFRTNESKAWRDSQTLPILTQAEESELLSWVDFVNGDKRAHSLLEGVQVEVSMFADDSTGLRLKGRADAVGADYFVDLKTVRDASPDGLSKAILEYGWHRQAAMYLRIASLLGKPQTRFFIIALQKSTPPRLNVREMHESAIDLGNCELDEAFELLLKCKRTNTWPGYSGPGDTIQKLDVPSWAHLQWANKHPLTGMTKA